MSSYPYIQLYVGDYRRDTAHLTDTQHGQYLLLLMALWTSGGKLPNDQKKLARIACCKNRRIAPEVMEFFTIKNGCIVQKRISAELKKATRKSANLSRNGALGGRPKSLKHKESHKAEGLHARVLPEPKSESEREKRENKKREKTGPHTIPPDWAPSDDDRTYGQNTLGLSLTEIEADCQEMIDWARANAHRAVARKSDWHAAARTWMRRNAERRTQREPQFAGRHYGGNGAAGPPDRRRKLSMFDIAMDETRLVMEKHREH